MVDWSELPRDPLLSIAERLIPFLLDYVCFAAVCTAWRSAALEVYCLFSSRLPSCRLLPLPFPDGSWTLGFTYLAGRTTSQTFSLDLPLDLEQQFCCGSSHGWLVMLDKSPSLHLLHPFSKRRIQLPPFPTSVVHVVGPSRWSGTAYIRRGYPCPIYWSDIQRRTVRKIILSSDPTAPGECIVLALLAGLVDKPADVGFCRIGDEAWSFQDRTLNFMDARYHGGRFYLMDLKGTIMICDAGSPPRAITVVPPPREWPRSPGSAVIGMSGGRLAVCIGFDSSLQGASEVRARIPGRYHDTWCKVFFLEENGTLVEGEEGLELEKPPDTGLYYYHNAIKRGLFYRIQAEDQVIEQRVTWPFCQYPVLFTPKLWDVGLWRYLVRGTGRMESEDTWITQEALRRIDPYLLEHYQGCPDLSSTESCSSLSGIADDDIQPRLRVFNRRKRGI